LGPPSLIASEEKEKTRSIATDRAPWHDGKNKTSGSDDFLYLSVEGMGKKPCDAAASTNWGGDETVFLGYGCALEPKADQTSLPPDYRHFYRGPEKLDDSNSFQERA